MKKYENLSGESGVIGYEIEQGSITVYFRDGSIYLYTNTIPGPEDVIEMQRLAESGRGLNSFISRVVKKNYAKKIR